MLTGSLLWLIGVTISTARSRRSWPKPVRLIPDNPRYPTQFIGADDFDRDVLAKVARTVRVLCRSLLPVELRI